LLNTAFSNLSVLKMLYYSSLETQGYFFIPSEKPRKRKSLGMKSVEACSGSRDSMLCWLVDPLRSTNEHRKFYTEEMQPCQSILDLRSELQKTRFLFGSEERADEKIPLGFRGCVLHYKSPVCLFLNATWLAILQEAQSASKLPNCGKYNRRTAFTFVNEDDEIVLKKIQYILKLFSHFHRLRGNTKLLWMSYTGIGSEFLKIARRAEPMVGYGDKLRVNNHI